jgi:hypothetical protein
MGVIDQNGKEIIWGIDLPRRMKCSGIFDTVCAIGGNPSR